MPLHMAEDGRIRVERLYDQLGPALLAYATSLTGNRGAGEDVLHQVFLRLLDTGTVVPEDARPYLFRAVRNTASNWRRGDVRETARRAAVPMFSAPPGLAETGLELERLLAELPDEQRQIVVLRVWGELTIEQAAEVAGIPANTASSRYRYALERLRQRLGVRKRA